MLEKNKELEASISGAAVVNVSYSDSYEVRKRGYSIGVAARCRKRKARLDQDTNGKGRSLIWKHVYRPTTARIGDLELVLWYE